MEEADEHPPVSALTPTAENQAEPALELPTLLESESIPELEITDSSSENMVYVPSFGWIERQGPNQVEYAEDIYKNGNKIDIMG